MINGHKECLAIVQRKGHLDQALLTVNDRTTHFVCMSMETLIVCRQRGFSASTPSNYDQLRGDFTVKGQELARRWINDVIAEPFALSKEQQVLLVTRFTFFFAMALFAVDLIKAVTEQHRPRKVYLWRDTERQVLGDWPPGSGEGAIFAQVAAAWLAGQGISFEFLDRSEEHDALWKSKRSLVDSLRSCKSHLPRGILPGIRSLHTLGKSLHTRIQGIKLRTHVALLQWRRYYRQRPIILFWGAGTDAVYQAELARQWKKERGWYVLRVESSPQGWLSHRFRTRNGDVPFGISGDLVLQTFGSSVQKAELPDMENLLAQTADWWSTAHPAGRCIGANLGLGYQVRAMIQHAARLKDRIQSVTDALRALSLDCVATHTNSVVMLAARQAGIPSVMIAHGGIVSPYVVSMHGDVNVVSGNIQKEYYEEVGHYSGKLLALGWPHIDLPRLRTASVTVPTSRVSNSVVPTVTFLADNHSSGFYYWERVDFDAYARACQRLRELAHAHPFRLIVKLHPRYGDVSLFQQLFEPDGVHVRLEATPSLAEVLEETDLAVISLQSTAIMEVALCQVPGVLFSYHYKPDELRNPYYRKLARILPLAGNLQQLEQLVLQFLGSCAHRTELVRRQDLMLPQMLHSCGEEASRYVADACQQLLNHKGPQNQR